MPTTNAENIRVTRDYLIYLREARRLSETSVDAAAAAIAEFQAYTKARSFKSFHIQQAIAFKKQLKRRNSQRSGGPLSPTTVAATLNALRAFFQWLAGRPGYRSRISYADADYFRLPEKEARALRTTAERYPPTLEQIRQVIARMPFGSDIEKRDRAVIAFTLLSGARDGAMASLKLKHVDVVARRVDQDARDVDTKFSKSFATYFFPVGEDIREIIVAWVDHLRTTLLFGPEDPLFPATRIGLDADNQFASQGLSRQPWSTASPIRNIFKSAFQSAQLPYAHPQSVRRTLARLGEERCRTPEEFKAWSQNLGHDHVLTTFTAYGGVSQQRQAEIIGALGDRPSGQNTVVKQMRQLLEQLAAAPASFVSGTTPNGRDTVQLGHQDDQHGHVTGGAQKGQDAISSGQRSDRNG